MSLCKCRFCKKDITKEGAYIAGKGMYYCNEQHYKLQQDKIKYKAPKENKNGEPNDRRLLTDYIQEQFVNQGWDKHDINWKIMTAQVKNMQEENPNLNYNWIRYCLWYLIEIKESNLFDENFNGSILNLVPFVYQEAYQYWKDTRAIKESVKNLSYDLSEQTKVVSVNCNVREKKLNWEDL